MTQKAFFQVFDLNRSLELNRLSKKGLKKYRNLNSQIKITSDLSEIGFTLLVPLMSNYIAVALLSAAESARIDWTEFIIF